MLRQSRRALGGAIGPVQFSEGHKLSGAKYFLKYSRPGPFSTYSFRQRYPVLVKNTTDSAVADFFTNKCIGAWHAEYPSFNYYFGAALSLTVSTLFSLRHLYFNPDVVCRHNEKRLPLPDRLRQWSYALPFANCRLKNWCNKFKWIMCQNEPDWNDINWMGMRPNREQSHRVCMFWNIFHWGTNTYRFECPYYESVTHKNMCRIYHDIDYKKAPEFFGSAEE